MIPKYASDPAPTRPLDSSSIQRRGPIDVATSTLQGASQSSRWRAAPSLPSMTSPNRTPAPATNAAVASAVTAAAASATA